jgi:hypothetical protein
LLERTNDTKDENLDMSSIVPIIWFLDKSNFCSEYFAHPFNIRRYSLNLFLDRSSDLKEHKLPNDFGIPPSKEFPVNLKVSNLDGKSPSGTFPLNILFERSIDFKFGNIERSGNLPVIWFPYNIKFCSEYLAHRDDSGRIVEMSSLK